MTTAPGITQTTMEGFERLYREDGARLERALVLFTADREIARDAVAESFARAIRHREQLRTPQAWVWRVAFRIASEELKQRSAAPSRREANYEMPESLVDLQRALSHLSPKQRASIVLHHYAGYSAKEIAPMIGSTPPAVSVHLSVGRKRLRALLEVPDE